MLRLSVKTVILLLSALLPFVHVSPQTLVMQDAVPDDSRKKISEDVMQDYYGVSAFSKPFDAAFSVRTWGGANRAIMYVTDSDWNRIMFSDRYGNFIRAFGSHGSGNNQMKNP